MIHKIKHLIFRNPVYLQIKKYLKSHSFYGFQEVSIYHVIYSFYDGIKKNSLTTRASSLSYSFLLAVFPLIIFIFSIVPYINISDFEKQLFLALKSILPDSAYQITKTTIHDLTSKKREGLLSFSFLFMIYLASDGVSAMIKAFNESAHIEIKMGYIQLKITSLIILFLMFISTIIAIVAIVFNDIIFDYLISFEFFNNQGTIFLVNISKTIVLAMIFLVSISLIYKLGCKEKFNQKFFSIGALTSVILNISFSYGFAFYINHFSRYNKIYGSLGTLIIIMLWIYLNTLSILMGFELNASIYKARKKLTLKSKKI